MVFALFWYKAADASETSYRIVVRDVLFGCVRYYSDYVSRSNVEALSVRGATRVEK